MQIMDTWLVKFQKEVWKSLKDSVEAIEYFELRICGSDQLPAEEWAMINKRPEPLNLNLHFAGLIIAGQVKLTYRQ